MRLARCLATCTTHTSHPPTGRCSPRSVRWPHPPSSGAGIFPPTSKRLVPSTARRLTSRPLWCPLARANSRPFPRRRVVPRVVCIYAFMVNTRAALLRFRLRGRHAGLECRNLSFPELCGSHRTLGTVLSFIQTPRVLPRPFYLAELAVY